MFIFNANTAHTWTKSKVSLNRIGIKRSIEIKRKIEIKSWGYINGEKEKMNKSLKNLNCVSECVCVLFSWWLIEETFWS